MPIELNMATVHEAAAVAAAARERQAAAIAALVTVKNAAIAAQRAAAAAIGDPLALIQAERDAQDALKMAERVAAMAEQQRIAAERKQHAAWGVAHEPLHVAGRQMRLEAVKRADAARAELAAAAEQFKSGTELVMKARAEGHPATKDMDGAMLVKPIATAATETALWETP